MTISAIIETMAGHPTHVFTARIPIDVYEAVSLFAFASSCSTNEVVVQALRHYLQAQAALTEVDAKIDAARAQLRAVIENLSDK